jgi:hypothetical protein
VRLRGECEGSEVEGGVWLMRFYDGCFYDDGFLMRDVLMGDVLI